MSIFPSIIHVPSSSHSLVFRPYNRLLLCTTWRFFIVQASSCVLKYASPSFHAVSCDRSRPGFWVFITLRCALVPIRSTREKRRVSCDDHIPSGGAADHDPSYLIPSCNFDTIRYSPYYLVSFPDSKSLESRVRRDVVSDATLVDLVEGEEGLAQRLRDASIQSPVQDKRSACFVFMRSSAGVSPLCSDANKICHS